MGVLREKMIEEMKLRNFASRTQKSYVAAMVGLARHYHRFPDQLTQGEIRTYLLHCIFKSEAYRPIRRMWQSRGCGFSISKFWAETKSSCSCRRENGRGGCPRC